jgi:hypothetical protein
MQEIIEKDSNAYKTFTIFKNSRSQQIEFPA